MSSAKRRQFGNLTSPNKSLLKFSKRSDLRTDPHDTSYNISYDDCGCSGSYLKIKPRK
jgi:hypothetical protein